ncbi:serine/threonine-protein kinase [Streptomyces sp. 35G-GA-8]|uniref:serine/threonine-protein kinase n=1 Tax=Streptomyces sp. 35G-GA-8 TaxID=2939434 RepID=UPI00201E8916|nr:serine/threonine-protein kinase [Streptomyces sp. 35G-GA-8]MCL7381005.1 serine/threonine-protein kinase [Streptomyces sp. 35G-GA-8]
MPPLRNTGSAPEAERPDYAGRYLLEAALGSGGMGVVHLATSASGLRLAVKVIHTNHASDPEFRARFRQEVAAARRVSGAFTAPVVDADPEAERPWMATLFIDGPTLSERVKRNGPLDAEELTRLGAGLAEGLRDIHRAGVVHRDLKPSNVLLASDGPKVIDFGISRPTDSDLRTETGKLIGTPPFMAPEQFQRPREVGPAADVFAMGAVLVHAATGRGPFDSDSPYIVAYQVVHNEPDLAGVPEQLLPLITRCLAKDPADRPTPDEMMATLRPSSAPGADGRRGARVSSSGASALRTSGLRASPLVPAQRVPDRAENADPDPATHARPAGSRTRHLRIRPAERAEGAEGAESAAGTEPHGAEPESGRPAARPRRRIRRWAAIGVVLAAAAAAAGFAGARASMDDGAADPARPAEAKGPGGTFQPWHIKLPDTGGGNHIPVCSAAEAAVYCTAPGIKAARLDPADGRLDWSVKGDKTAAEADAGAAPVLSGGLLHVISPGGARLEALDPGSGGRRWSTPLSSYASVRHVGDTVLLVGYDGRVRSLDSATGDERWSRQRGGTGTVWTAPTNGTGGDGALFAATPSSDGRATDVSSIDPADGAVRWEKRLTGSLIPAGASDDALFLLSEDADGYTNEVVRVDASTRTVRRVPLATPVDQAQATVAGDTVYVIGYTGSLLAVDTTGSGGAGAAGGGGSAGLRWRLETSVTRASEPTAAGNRVYLSAGDGRLLAVDAERGVLLGQTKPRMDDGPHTLVATLPAPVTEPGAVFATAPDGSVFAVDSRQPDRW